MQKIPKIAAICVNWNGGDALRETLESLLASDYPRLEVLVVDNASTDDSLSRLPRDIQLLRLPVNAGYGEAINQGIAFLEGKKGQEPACYFLALNNDVRLDRDTVSGLVKHAEKNGPGVYGPAVVQASRPERLEAAWGRLTWSHVLTRLEGKNEPAGSSPWNQPRKDGILLGSVLLVHRSVIDAEIWFDPLFFMYHEEVDFIYRAGMRGFPSFYFPKVRARHRVGMGTRKNPLKKVYWTRRNTIYFLKKHQAGPGRWIKCLGSMLGGFMYAAARLDFGRAGAISAGFIDGLRGISENQNLEG